MVSVPTAPALSNRPEPDSFFAAPLTVAALAEKEKGNKEKKRDDDVASVASTQKSSGRSGYTPVQNAAEVRHSRIC